MQTNNNVSQVHLQHPASVDAYIRHGWGLVPIPPGTKGPQHEGWNLPQNTLKRSNDLPPGYGIGLAHAYSGTMALDIDRWDKAKEELLTKGIDLDQLYNAPDAVIIDSGKQGHGKLLYKMPANLILPSKKLIDKDQVTGQKYNYLDFRCATKAGKTVQDVLPPSIHPDTMQPYRWAGLGRWEHLPEIPQLLLQFWQGEIAKETQIQNSTPINPDSIDWQELQTALFAISADISRDEWINVGMALHWAGHQTGQLEHAFSLWDAWSSTATGQNWEGKAKYQGEKDLMNSWRSFNAGNGITTATLYDMAFDHGFKPKDPDVSELFSATQQPVIDPKDILYPPPPDINLEYFPPLLAQRAQEISDHIGCDPLVPLWAGISAVCGVIDARTRLELMPGFKVAPVLWMMTIGEPADKKSPGSKPMFDALKQIEKEDRPTHKKKMQEWAGLEAAHDAAHKSFIEYCQNPENILSNDAPPVVPDLPNPPVPLKITVSDITSQKLVRHAADRPRGLLCYLDEMNSWVRKMASVQSGEDRSAWVQAYEADYYEMDRVGAGSIHCDNFAVSVYGNIQPTVFRDNVKILSGDGLLQRFIPAVLRGNMTRLGNPVDESLTSKATWELTLRQIYAMPAITYQLSSEALGAYRGFQYWYEEQKFNERILKADPVFMTAFGKLEGLVGRLALVWHVLENPYSMEISQATMEKVIAFVKSYHVPAIRYTYDTVGGLVEDSIDYWLMDHVIYHSDQERLELSELKHSARRKLDKLNIKNSYEKGQLIRDAMLSLELSNWVQLIHESKRGATWMINPQIKDIFKDMRNQVIKARQARLDDALNKASTKKGYMERRYVKHYEPETMD